MPKPLSHRDIEQLLASALGIERYCIEDVFDDKLVYRNNAENPTGYYEVAYSIDKDGKVTKGVPVKVLRRTTYEPMVKPATFAVEAGGTTEGNLVLRTGKLFEAGDYPDKHFSLTEAELEQAVTTFTPVRNNLEHVNTVLDGQLGEVRRVERRGRELFGTVAIPKWLDTVIGPEPLKASLEWARDTKQIVGNALVLNPRVPDAQLVAAFHAAHTPPAKEKPMSLLATLKALFSGEKEPTEEDVKAAIKTEGDATAAPPPKDGGEQAADNTPEPPATQPPAGFSAEGMAGLQRSLLKAQAEAWFAQELTAGHVFPAQKDSLVAAFTQAAMADAGNTVCFSEDGTLKEGAMLQALKASVAAYPKHSLTSEQLAGDIVVLSATPAKQASAERMAALRATYGIKKAE